MFKRNPQNKEHLDRAGKLVLRAAVADELEIEAASESPFLFTRVRARIAERQRENESGWQSLPLIAWRAIPAMALVATLAGGLTLWTARPANTENAANTPAVGFGMYEDALTDTTDPGVEQTVLSRNNLSHEDVLNIVIERGEVEKKK
ncbi:MAG TPA: hypothetical protein VGQ72_03470 [Pyrinomonadaceae bacterium]|jgi:hypothetical protein|nr:hypothetical protein [Pyrinomonadaceae bacterium]